MSTTSSSLPSEPTPAGAKRVNVIFSDEQFEKLQQIALSQNISIEDALRQAIGLASLVVDANSDPNTKILFKTGDSVNELYLSRQL